MNKTENLSTKYKNKLTIYNENLLQLNNILLQMEVTNACNHRCYFCPNNDSTRRKTMMDLEFAKKAILECSGFLGEGKKICFHMNGEPLLYPNLSELIKLSKKVGYEYVFITTNGSVATNELLNELFEAGLDSIKFSINAGDKESYSYIHGKDDYEKVISAVKYSYNYRKENRKNFRIFISCVVTKDNYLSLGNLKKEVGDYCDEIVYYNPCGYAGQNNKLANDLRCNKELQETLFDIVHTAPCAVLWNSINITCEGYLSLCCSESDNRLVVEDLNNMSIKDAWLGNKMNMIRELHKEQKIVNMPCNACVNNVEYVEEEIDNEYLFKLSYEKRKCN